MSKLGKQWLMIPALVHSECDFPAATNDRAILLFHLVLDMDAEL